ncbi:two-component system regulatory protein YycI [Sedimentibacter sp. zth1]|uniref:two-component system regulatory protein YycI n=1 Tax=Sedimentibacter sp. zth1 TaxID=2816908 RepID=UPI001A91CB10|nr:two-component system regulatory protein YycI [Sedimentibacter sp. zth1]QSX05023.1 two-component system regulatory protein YycI [Sedimentibacter sp. zth1]
MDWNKSNTILIIAFLIVNIFLFSYTYYDDLLDKKQDTIENESFLQSVEEILETKNITIKCDIPQKIYKRPFLEIEYKIVHPSKKLIEDFLGEYSGLISDDINVYEKNDEKLEIVGGKKIIYSKETPSNIEINNTKSADNIINEFCVEKNIDLSNFIKDFTETKDNTKIVRFVQRYKGYKVENSYIRFYISKGDVIGYEKQFVANISERATVNVVSATEALLRLMVYEDIHDCKITDIEICYYTKENKDFEVINSINVDLVWKVIIDNNKIIYLVSSEY